MEFSGKPSELHALIQEAANRQVFVQSIEYSYKTRQPCPGLLLGYASMTAAEIRVAVRRLAQSL